MHKFICQKYTEHIWQVLFEIGVVWEDINKVLNHSVAEVVLLLQGEAEEKCHFVHLCTCKCRNNRKQHNCE